MPDVLMFTETWLKPTTNDAELGLKKFSILRLDRHDSPNNCVLGGGVLLDVNKKLKSALLENVSVTEIMSAGLTTIFSWVLSRGLTTPSSTNSVPNTRAGHEVQVQDLVGGRHI